MNILARANGHGDVADQQRIGGDADVTGEVAECKHAPDASTYNRMASLWKVEQKSRVDPGGRGDMIVH